MLVVESHLNLGDPNISKQMLGWYNTPFIILSIHLSIVFIHSLICPFIQHLMSIGTVRVWNKNNNPNLYYKNREDLRCFRSSNSVTYEVRFLISYSGFKLSKTSCFCFACCVTTWMMCSAEEIFF